MECIYKLTYQPDSNNIKSVYSENFSLLIGRKFSVSQSINKIKTDSIIAAIVASNNTPLSVEYPRTDFMDIVYKNIPTGKTTTIDYIGIKKYAYIEDLSNFNWKLSDQKRNIAGYDCQKAVASYAGRIWEAWYTKELPVSEGPYKFSGLPGLIIEMNDTKKYYNFTIVNVKTKKSYPIIAKKIEIPYITKREFREGADNYKKNYINIRISEGNGVYGDIETARKRVEDNYKRKNNPLELDYFRKSK